MLNLSQPQKLRILFIVNIILVFVFVLDLGFWLFFVSVIYGILLNIIGNNIGLHRYFSHRSFEVNNDLYLKILSTLCGIGSQINYCMIHRYHHKCSDTSEDPHDPNNIGLFRSLIMDYKPVAINPRIVRDLFNDKELKFIHQNYYKLIYIWMILLTIIDIKYTIAFFSIPALMCWISAVAIGIIPHKIGYRYHDTNDNSHNSILASFVSFGEGWHNYHHNNPKDYRHGKQWWEFDPAAKIIDVIKKKDNK